MKTNQPTVCAVHCDHQATDEEIYAALRRVTLPLDRAWDRLRKANRIGIKFNQAYPPDRRPIFKGHFQELASEQVARATLRLLREETDADLFCIEISVFKHDRDPEPGPTIPFLDLLREFDVPFVDGNLPPQATVRVPGGGQMFDQYTVPQDIVEADAFVSVQKMKNHAFMGVTLCLKNLFGLLPQEPHGRSRRYFHHLVRMPYMLADIGRIFDPALNIIDALTCQAGREWGGEPRIGDALIAGDQVIATDAVGTHLMGHDPLSDWLTPPFHRDRNALLVAALGGFGTVNLDEIDLQSELQAPLSEFYNVHTDERSRVINWRRTTAEQALYYRDHRQQFIDHYAGEYILLQDGEVHWHDTSSEFRGSRRDLSGGRPDSAMWLKYVDPDEVEGEHYEVYEQALAQIEALDIEDSQ
ncbi:MAG: DUF362 domain-containing protein [Anaerolineae bacterium]|nr:DUF362 domain-containing protein [Anaerolineae bacterium]